MTRILILFFLALGVMRVPEAQENPYDFEYLQHEPGKRLALVVGNVSYQHLPPLPGVVHDIDQVSEKLEALKFDVTTATDVQTGSELQLPVLVEFRRKIYEGDLVVVFLSGHGFSYGGHNYFATTTIPETLSALRITEYALPVLSMAEFLGQNRPGGLLFFVDACRNIGDFIYEEENPLINKGSELPASTFKFDASDYSIAWAQEAGFSAYGSNDQPSIYTRHLLEHLGSQDNLLESMLRDVKVAVEDATRGRQSPGITSWSNADIYLNATDDLEEEFRVSWLSHLSTKDPTRIRTWIRRNGLNPYVKSARRWLKDYATGELGLTSFTRVSPGAVAFAWAESQPANRSIAVSAVSDAVPLAFERSISYVPGDQIYTNPAWDNQLFDLMLEEAKTRQFDVERFERAINYARAFSFSDAAVVTNNFRLLSEPRSDSEIQSSFKVGDTVRITDFIPAMENQVVWLEVQNSDNQKAYVEISAPDRAGHTLALGRAIAELEIRPNPSGLDSLVDSEQLLDSIQSLKDAGYVFTRISIGGNFGPNEGTREGAIKEERAVHARFILGLADIDTGRVTMSPNVSAEGNGLTTIRILGYRVK